MQRQRKRSAKTAAGSPFLRCRGVFAQGALAHSQVVCSNHFRWRQQLLLRILGEHIGYMRRFLSGFLILVEDAHLAATST
jgi:hypothetical protein